ncbi:MULTISPECIES: APC family permease [Metallosphaera]|nr:MULTISPECIES: APC family permease [Metallosphaera]AKV73963.1 hypothetical protein MsedA_0905 [Metallosphaera sedula]AKV76202.1 hypothetical protein MsedB_0906 [Metallosphaera sedula]AKV78455.1 hypothetical protein MsedC_0905 [Metallosphaera sedula]AKV80700.1 hypothetical protein MsedD_0906 [Metallosphaera sedula]MCH1771980.1 APC family permease [Metallosphaera sedula]
METKNYLNRIVVDNPNFRKSAGLLSMIAFSLGNIIGSGILLLPAVTASMAGGLTPLVWLAGGIMLLPLVFVYSQLAKMYPVVGSKVRFVNVTHGKVLASSVGWLYLIGTLFVVPIEAEASLQYLSYIFPSLWSNGSPTLAGDLVEIGIVSAIYFLVYMGIRTQSLSVNVITYTKLGILALYVALVGILAFHPSNFTIPTQSGTSTFLDAIALTMFAYGGFRSAMVYAGESKNKNQTGKAILIAFLLSMIVYTLVPIVFIGSLTPEILGHGWGYVSKMSAPLTQSALIAGIPVLGALFIIDGVISPSGASLIGAGDISRYMYALVKVGSAPKGLGKVSEKRGIPVIPTLLSLLASIVLLFVSPTFEQSIGYLIAAHVLGYATGPISLYVLTSNRGYKAISMVGFITSGLIYTWLGFPKTLFGTLIIGVSMLVMAMINRPVKPALWYVGYAMVLTTISVLVSNTIYEIIATLALAPVFFALAIKSAKGSGEVEA